MDIYGLVDLIAIVLAGIVAVKMKNSESLYLLSFFSLSAISSFILFQTEYFIYWPIAFTALCVIFGSASYRHPVVMGYAVYLLLIGLNQMTEVHLYSLFVYLIFAYQLWVIRYGHDHGHHIRWLRSSHNCHSLHKITQKGKS